MTNASMKNMFAVLSAVAVAFVISVGAFASVAHADDYSGSCDFCGYDAGYTDYSYPDAGYTDYSYSNPGYTDYSYSDPGYTDYSWSNPGYTDYSWSNPGYTDYSWSNPGYTDYSWSNPGYTDYSYTDYGYTDYGYTDYGYTDYSGYSSGYGYSGPTSNGGYSFSAPSSYYSTPSYSTPSYSTPSYSYSVPSTSSVTPVYSSPSYSYPTYNYYTQPTRTTTTASSQPINIVNNNVNTNTNTNPVTVTTVTPISSGYTQYPVVYQPTYTPSYTYPTYYPTYYQRPTCSIMISNYSGGTYGLYGSQLATLTWSSNYGTSAYITPNVGTVALSGSMTVYPTSGTVYTMTVSGAGGSSTCQSAPYYIAQPIVYQNPTPVAPVTPSVSLSQIPYTGFDFGFLGNSLYWLALLSFAAAGAYLMVYYRGGAMSLATAMTARSIAMKPVKAVEKVVEATAQTIEDTIVQPVLSLGNLPVSESFGTKDTMSVVQANGDNEMPRIIITRE